MSRKRRRSPLEDLVELASLLPYWVSLIIAVIAYFFFHSYAATDAQPVIQSGSPMPQNMGGMLFRTFSQILQYLVPFAFLLGALGSAFKTFKGKQLAKLYTQYESSSEHQETSQTRSQKVGKPTDGMNWQQFELLVGEAFSKQGYRVIHGGDAGADGGVDVHLRKEGKEYLVQCKHWKTRKVGVAVIRELYGVMASVGAAGGFIVTSGEFTEEAEAFSEGKSLTLISGDELSRMLGRAVQGSSEAVDEAKVNPTVIYCPKCSSPMVKRVAKRGKNAGQEFMGCTRYPKCRGVISAG